MKIKTIGVLAVQGDVEPHLAMLQRVGANSIAVRRAEELLLCDGLILPGGESTAMTKLLHFIGMYDPLLRFAAEKKPMWGTCAGCILLGKQGDDPRVRSLGVMDITVARNAYGRQTESFTMNVTLREDPFPLPGVFIRAPIISQVGETVQVVGTLGEQIVHVEQGHLWASTFHPELTNDERLHRKFVEGLFC
ncbi:MAG: pyridoxal 5'-phosphate synthase glutaminase subunit PdxT [bacterium]|nr:pyridoxal 5'-phosphate synthase glutaminase subunit PdxT [bacterium]